MTQITKTFRITPTAGRIAGRMLVLSIVVFPSIAKAQDYDPNSMGTFSIIARDPSTGELGMAVQSKAFAAGNRAMTIKGGVAVIAHQASANPMYGSVGLELLAAGMAPQQALDFMVRADDGRDNRQVAILDMQGRSAAWTGKGANDWKGHRCGVNYCAQGNILVGEATVAALAQSFESSTGPLAERLMDALDAAQAAGGDARGMQSGALVIVRPLAGSGGFSDRVIDIRVDDHKTPLVELRRLLKMVRSGQLITDANRKVTEGNLAAATEIGSEGLRAVARERQRVGGHREHPSPRRPQAGRARGHPQGGGAQPRQQTAAAEERQLRLAAVRSGVHPDRRRQVAAVRRPCFCSALVEDLSRGTDRTRAPSGGRASGRRTAASGRRRSP